MRVWREIGILCVSLRRLTSARTAPAVLKKTPLSLTANFVPDFNRLARFRVQIYKQKDEIRVNRCKLLKFFNTIGVNFTK